MTNEQIVCPMPASLGTYPECVQLFQVRVPSLMLSALIILDLINCIMPFRGKPSFLPFESGEPLSIRRGIND